jgi:hypothetical protein
MDNPVFSRFIKQIREAYPGGWPVQTTGGFVATAWHSSLGVFIYVENPMNQRGDIHVAREGMIKIYVDELAPDAKVFDLCGGQVPDIRPLGKGQLSIDGDWVTVKLDWPRGDARLFWVH